MTATPTVSNQAVMRFWGDELTAPVLERVVGMLVARAQAPIDRLDDALLLTDAIAAHAKSFTGNGATAITAITSSTELALEVSPLDADGANGLVSATALPEIGNVLERLTSVVEHRDDTLHLTLSF